MELNQYLNNNDSTNLLKRFAYVGSKEAFDRKLHYLEGIAEPEKWKFTSSFGGDEVYVLFYYLVHTFDRCFKQNKIEINEDASVALFNTGLMTSAADEIYCKFTKSNSYNENDPTKCYWYLNSFISETSRDFMDLNMPKPLMASYFDDYNELYFNPDAEIEINIDHIFDDNFERLPAEIQMLGKTTAAPVLNGFLNHTKKKIRRNNRIPVPQFYNDKIMFLIPVKSFNDDETIVLALEKMANGNYRANTVLTMNMAYNCARLLTKPESNWLLPN